MADDVVHDAIKAHLQLDAVKSTLADTQTGEIPSIRFENEPFTPPNPSKPWIAMALTGGLYAQQSIGAHTQADNRWDETGHLWLPVLVEVDSGASRARQLSKQIANVFRGLTLLSGNLEFMDTFIGEAGPSKEDGNWFELPVVIEWRLVEA